MRKLAGPLFVLLVCCSAAAAVRPGDVGPDDLGSTRDGQAIHVSALRGKVVVISFWATWCEYCLKELPQLAGLQTVATQRGLPMQVVAVDYEEPRDTFRRSSRLLQSKLPSLLLTWDAQGAIRHAYVKGDAIPVMVMLHKDGTVAHVHVGYDEDDPDAFLAEINALLNEPAPAAEPASTPMQ